MTHQKIRPHTKTPTTRAATTEPIHRSYIRWLWGVIPPCGQPKPPKAAPTSQPLSRRPATCRRSRVRRSAGCGSRCPVPCPRRARPNLCDHCSCLSFAVHVAHSRTMPYRRVIQPAASVFQARMAGPACQAPPVRPHHRPQITRPGLGASPRGPRVRRFVITANIWTIPFGTCPQPRNPDLRRHTSTPPQRFPCIRSPNRR